MGASAARAPEPVPEETATAQERAREVACSAGVRFIGSGELNILTHDRSRALDRFDVRSIEQYERAHLAEWPAGGGRYQRRYEGMGNALAAMQAYLDWEFGLVAQLERDSTHGFFVI